MTAKNQDAARPISLPIAHKGPGYLHAVLDSIVVSIPACHAGDRGSIPRRGGKEFFFQPAIHTLHGEGKHWSDTTFSHFEITKILNKGGKSPKWHFSHL